MRPSAQLILCIGGGVILTLATAWIPPLVNPPIVGFPHPDSIGLPRVGPQSRNGCLGHPGAGRRLRIHWDAHHLQGLFGSSSDLTGLAFAWAEPYENLRNENVLEAFHRFQLTGRVQFTLGMQLILDPSDAPDADAVGVFPARLRITF